MRLSLLILSYLLNLSIPAIAAEPCQTIHGRAVMYNGDGQMRIWHIGGHHTFEPANDATWDKLAHFMTDPKDGGMMTKILFADFEICPTEPLIQGATQPAIIKRIRRPVVLTYEQWAALQKR